jgi:hypothetical protein
LVQVDGIMAISMGNISSLPISIAKVSTIFEKSEYWLKLYSGPIPPSPGPTLLKQVTAAVKLVSKVKGSKDNNRKSIKMHTI